MSEASVIMTLSHATLSSNGLLVCDLLSNDEMHCHHPFNHKESPVRGTVIGEEEQVALDLSLEIVSQMCGHINVVF